MSIKIYFAKYKECSFYILLDIKRACIDRKVFSAPSLCALVVELRISTNKTAKLSLSYEPRKSRQRTNECLTSTISAKNFCETELTRNSYGLNIVRNAV